jgi:hypothetical protein
MIKEKEIVIKNFDVNIIKSIKGFEDQFKNVFDNIKGFEQIICSTSKVQALIKEANTYKIPDVGITDIDGNCIKTIPELTTVLYATFTIADDYIYGYHTLEEFKTKLGHFLEEDPKNIDIIADCDKKEISIKGINRSIDTDSFVDIADDIRGEVLERINNKLQDINVITIIEGLQKASRFHLVEFKDKNNYVLESCEALSNGSKVQLIFTDTDTVLKYKI